MELTIGHVAAAVGTVVALLGLLTYVFKWGATNQRFIAVEEKLKSCVTKEAFESHVSRQTEEWARMMTMFTTALDGLNHRLDQVLEDRNQVLQDHEKRLREQERAILRLVPPPRSEG